MAVEKEQEGHMEEWREGMEGEMRQLYYNLKKKNNKKKKKKDDLCRCGKRFIFLLLTLGLYFFTQKNGSFSYKPAFP